MVKYYPKTLVEFHRDGLVEQYHTGFIVKYNSNGTFTEIGKSLNYPFYLRSCAKPLQASLIIDYGADKFYNMSLQEIAICCASHAGENCHINVLKEYMNKAKLDESMFKCGIHKPLSKTAQEQMLLNNTKETVLHNNCSGKHAMMLALCKMNGWSTSDYDSVNHPLQKAIKKQIYNLCEVTSDYPLTTDGCGVPIVSMPLKNMLKGFINLFCDRKYSKIKEAFLKYPYLIGGENRLDTAIIANSTSVIAKVGAGGLCIVVNTELKEGFVVKISDSDMRARAVVVIEILKKLDWLKTQHDDLIKQNPADILTLHGQKVGEAVFGDWINIGI